MMNIPPKLAWSMRLTATLFALLTLGCVGSWQARADEASRNAPIRVSAANGVERSHETAHSKHSHQPSAEPAPGAGDLYLSGPDVSAHNAWVLGASALVLFMTAPGLALYYGGLVRKKNVLNILMQCIFLMGLMSVLWALVGYSLTFSGQGWFIGNSDFVCMHHVARVWDAAAGKPVTPMFDGVLPRMTHMLFQCMFFVLTPAIICGAFAERMKFSSMVVFSVLWGLAVYCPLTHWIWGGGFLEYGNGLLGGAIDFAGGTVIHISSGVTALVAALTIGPRLGHRQEPMPPHNLTYTALGAAMLWVGWFGLNAGSALRINGIAANAFMTTHFSAAAGALTWACCEWWQRAKPSVLGASSGAISGLVCVTPAAGHVGPMAALAMGMIAAIACHWSCYRLKSLLGYDDVLDAFGVHGIGGTLGSLLTGVFATRAVSNLAGGAPLGAIEGNWNTLVGQLVACVIAWSYVALVSFAILKILDITIGLRVSSTMERQGLDVTQHGEEGYIFL